MVASITDVVKFKVKNNFKNFLQQLFFFQIILSVDFFKQISVGTLVNRLLAQLFKLQFGILFFKKKLYHNILNHFWITSKLCGSKNRYPSLEDHYKLQPLTV